MKLIFSFFLMIGLSSSPILKADDNFGLKVEEKGRIEFPKTDELMRANLNCTKGNAEKPIHLSKMQGWTSSPVGDLLAVNILVEECIKSEETIEFPVSVNILFQNYTDIYVLNLESLKLLNYMDGDKSSDPSVWTCELIGDATIEDLNCPAN